MTDTGTEMTLISSAEGGGPEVMHLEVGAVPGIADDEILVAVNFAGVNGPDLMQRRGLYPPPKNASPILGLEVAGVVSATGKNVTRWQVGDRVCALTNGGGYAEYVAVRADHCLAVPAGLSLAEAAALPETYFTVWSNVFMEGGLGEGQIFLVHGGAGGIGTTSIQLGQVFGAKVYATDSPAERCGICTELGAERVIDYQTEDFVEVVRSEAGGADIILDIVGGNNVAKNIKAAVPGGRIIQLAFAAGSNVEINLMPIMLKRITYTGSTLRSRTDAYKAEIARQLETLVWPLLETRKLRAVIHKIFPLKAAAEAHQLMESAAHTGKILLEINSDLRGPG